MTVTGMKAYGKTTFTRWVAKNLNRILVLDPTWQLGSLGYVVHKVSEIAPAFQRFKKVVFQPLDATDEAYRGFFSVAKRFCNYTLIIDEVEEVLPSKYVKIQDAKTIAVRGRAQGIGIIANTRRPKDINNCVRTQTDHVVSFCVQEEADLEYVSKWILKSEQEIRDLQPYHSFYRNVAAKTTIHLNPCPEV